MQKPIKKLKRWVLWEGECIEKMRKIPDNKIDMIICDLPFRMTDSRWDILIPFEDLWFQYKRIIKKNGAIVLNASQPFTSLLVSSNLKWFKTEWIWVKNAGSNFGTVKYHPMKEHESVLIFCEGTPVYNPIMQERAAKGLARVKTVVNYNSQSDVFQNGALNKQVSAKRPDLRYPSSVQKWNRERGLHPNQKPVDLCSYFLKTYSNENDLILDNCAGSGTSGIAALQTNRRVIMIEKERKYCQIIKERMNEYEKAT